LPLLSARVGAEEEATVSDEENGEAHTLGLLRELRELAEEISDGHMDYAHRFHELLRRVRNPNLPDVAQDFGFKVISCQPGTGTMTRTVAVCANVTIARAAWDCACKIFPNERWILTWGGMVQFDSERSREK
jgi:hypothetical protein